MKIEITSSAAMDATDFALVLANSDDPAREPSDLLADLDCAVSLLGPLLTEDEDPVVIATQLTPFRDVLRKSLLGAATSRQAKTQGPPSLSEALMLPWRMVEAASGVVSFAPEGTAAQRLSAWAALGYFLLVQDLRDRLRVCESSPCEEIFQDDTKSGRQRFCSKRCANRFNVARHRARQKDC